ncbi:MAG: hypothetical protein AAFQ84_02375, partial [Pseudomonadota bacterium]
MWRKLQIVAIGFAMASIIAGCDRGASLTEADASRTDSAVSARQPAILPWGYPLDVIDTRITPGENFFLYANGRWIDETEIPPDRSGTGFSTTMRKRNERRIADIIEEA